ncbi:MAG: hypothetical protein ACFB2X_27270 [Rivularia sp. (in: cyanobacteria)]
MVALEKKCPALNYKMNCSECPKVNHEWHIDRILQDLAKAKAEQDFENGKIRDKLETKELSPKQLCWLYLLLLGFSVEEIQDKLNRQQLTADLSKTLFKYVYIITKKKINNWAQFRLYLERYGYRKASLIEEETLEISLSIKIPKNSSNQYIEELVNKINQISGNGTMTLIESYEQGEIDDEQ